MLCVVCCVTVTESVPRTSVGCRQEEGSPCNFGSMFDEGNGYLESYVKTELPPKSGLPS